MTLALSDIEERPALFRRKMDLARRIVNQVELIQRIDSPTLKQLMEEELQSLASEKAEYSAMVLSLVNGARGLLSKE